MASFVGLGVALLIIGVLLAAFNVLGGAAGWLMWVGLILIGVGVVLTLIYYLAGASTRTRLPP